MTIVVDASIALKWLLPEPDSIDAEGVASGDHLLIAPTLVIAESCNAVWQRLRRRPGARPTMRQLVVARTCPSLFAALVADAGLAPLRVGNLPSLDHPAVRLLLSGACRTGGGDACDRRPAAGGARARYALGGPGGGSRRLGRDEMRTLDDVPLAPAEREAIEAAAAVALRARFPVTLLARKVEAINGTRRSGLPRRAAPPRNDEPIVASGAKQSTSP